MTNGLDAESVDRLEGVLAWAKTTAHEYAEQARAVGRRRTLAVEITVDQNGHISRKGIRLTGDHLQPEERSRLTAYPPGER